MNEFERRIPKKGKDGLFARGVDIIQVNIGLKCNQVCDHCHLDASPDRREVMGREIMERVLEIMDEVRPQMVDLTGGAPELNPDLKWFLSSLTENGLRVQIRTNLTALLEPGLEDLPGFFRDHRVDLVASMPCYLEENVRNQRGPHVYERSIEAIRMLNGLGYGTANGLKLDLVYNPGGAFLPGDQDALEEAYRKELRQRFGIQFTNLLTITNMPIGRFQEGLRKKHKDKKYLALLKDSFNPGTVDGLMCRRQISIGWNGDMYDCDFNLALDMTMDHGAPDHVSRFDIGSVAGRRIVTGIHCFGCTAGRGSSCGGALA
ncbi:MAG: arsenosugar biosynthesis radical SAM protein ArsS [bacterium]|nr:MAG: arsenosugar biosynthesis radical SAM protein ArsS [bacterium]